MSVRDALGREVRLSHPPSRIVSLVPSETESVIDLVGVARLVGRTDFCIEPRGVVEQVPSIGGTKGVDVHRVIALAPDLVLANQEENARGPIEKLIAAGLPVHVSFPCGVAEAVRFLETLAVLLHVPPDAEPIAEVARAFEEAQRAALSAGGESPRRVFVPIWKDPWMSFDGRTYASDIIELCGGHNVFSDRPRRYPLAADIGDAPPLCEVAVGQRDTRYPRVTLDEVVARAPELVLLPDEPYAFGQSDREALAQAFPAARVRLWDGKDLFWYGTRIARALPRLRAALEGV